MISVQANWFVSLIGREVGHAGDYGSGSGLGHALVFAGFVGVANAADTRRCAGSQSRMSLPL